MGWSSGTTWDLTFHGQQALAGFLADVEAHATQQGWAAGDLQTGQRTDRLAAAVGLCGETDPDCVILDGLHLSANTWGTWHGDDVLAIAADHADGVVDFTNNVDGWPFRARLHAGVVTQHAGLITSPGDPAAMPLAAAEARAIVTAIGSGEVDEYDLRALATDPDGWIEQSSTGVAGQLRADREDTARAAGAVARLTQPATATAAAPASPDPQAAGRGLR